MPRGERVVDHRDPRSADRHSHQDLRRVHGGAAGRNTVPACLATNQRPAGRLAVAREQSQRVVFREGRRLLRQAAPRDVGGCGVEASGERREPARGERRVVGDLADAKRDVDVLADEVDVARRQIEVERDPRMARHECRERRREQEVRQVVGHARAQAARRLGLPVRGDRPGGFDVLGDVPRVLEHRAAEIGQRERAGGAQEQPFAEGLFERRHAARHRRLGKAQACCGVREPAIVGDPGEDHEVVCTERVLSHIGNNMIPFCSFIKLNETPSWVSRGIRRRRPHHAGVLPAADPPERRGFGRATRGRQRATRVSAGIAQGAC